MRIGQCATDDTHPALLSTGLLSLPQNLPAHPPRRGPDNLQHDLQLHLVPWRIDQQKRLRHKPRPPPALGQRMPLAPPPLEHEFRVGGMQRHVQAAVDGVRVADLTPTGAVELRFGEEAHAVRLEAGDADAESRRMQVRHLGDFLGQSREGRFAAFLARLSVRRDAGDLRAGSRALGHPAKVADAWAQVGRDRDGCVGVFEGEEAEQADAEVAGDGRWCAAWAEVEEGGVVFVDEVACWEEEEEEEREAEDLGLGEGREEDVEVGRPG